MMDGNWLFGGGFMWIFWLIVIVLVLLLVRSPRGERSRPDDQPQASPMEILQRRYAKGEIDQEEFIRRKQDLEG